MARFYDISASDGNSCPYFVFYRGNREGRDKNIKNNNFSMSWHSYSNGWFIRKKRI